MNAMLQEPWTVERFLAWEDKQEGKHEFDGVRVIEMTGGSRNHQRIGFNLQRLLDDTLDPERFEAIQEMRITNGVQVRYPDVVVCRGPIGGGVRTLRDALVICEVLSDDTEDTDTGQKRHDYALLPAVRHYLIFDQHTIAVTALERTSDGWTETVVREGAIHLAEIGIALPLDAVYAKVRFR
jgi:hypothetical protein